MDYIDDENEDSNQNKTDIKSNYRRAILAIIGAIAIGVIGSGLYDLLVKPGISYFGTWFFKIVSRWSVSIENAPFSTAALDPSTLPSLIMVVILPVFFYMFLLYPIVKILMKKTRINKLLKSPKAIRLKIISITISILYLALIIVIFQTSTYIINKSIVIHRIFYANLKICSPYINTAEEEIFVSLFSRMENEEDYNKLNKQFVELASKNNISLRTETVK